MARLSNLYGAAPVASAQRRGGGGGGANRPNRPNNRGGGGGGLGVGGGKDKLGSGLYEGDEGEALSNQDPLAYFTNLLGAAGQSDYSGTPYGEYANKTRLDELMRQYGTAQSLAKSQSLSPVEWAQQQYGAGWTTTGGGGGGRHGNRKPGETTFNAGNLPTDTADSYNQWFSNTDPLSYLRSNATAGGGRIENGGNTDFQQWYDESFIPGVQSQLEAARANQPGPATPAPLTPAGGLSVFNPNADPNLYGPQTAPGPPGGPKLSLDDFVQGRDLVAEARNSYAFRPNARRLPGPLNASGRWSWWS